MFTAAWNFFFAAVGGDCNLSFEHAQPPPSFSHTTALDHENTKWSLATTLDAVFSHDSALHLNT